MRAKRTPSNGTAENAVGRFAKLFGGGVANYMWQ